MKFLFILIGLILPGSFYAQNDSLSISGTVTDEKGDPIAFANVTLLLNGNQILGSTVDFDGNYKLKPLRSGEYDVQFSFVGYKTKVIKNVIIKNENYRLNVVLKEGIQLSSCYFPCHWSVFRKDVMGTEKTFSREAILRMANF